MIEYLFVYFFDGVQVNFCRAKQTLTLCHNSVEFIGYLRQPYRGFPSLPSVFKVLRASLFTSEVGIT